MAKKVLFGNSSMKNIYMPARHMQRRNVAHENCYPPLIQSLNLPSRHLQTALLPLAWQSALAPQGLLWHGFRVQLKNKSKHRISRLDWEILLPLDINTTSKSTFQRVVRGPVIPQNKLVVHKENIVYSVGFKSCHWTFRGWASINALAYLTNGSPSYPSRHLQTARLPDPSHLAFVPQGA